MSDVWTARWTRPLVPSVRRMSLEPRALLSATSAARTVVRVALVVGCAVAATLLLLAVPGLPRASASCATGCPSVGTVTGGYVGSLLLPPGSRVRPASLRSSAADCDGCVWTLTPACRPHDA